MTSKYDLRGRKSILAFFSLSDWNAIMRKIKAGAPIDREPDGTWRASSEELNAWSAGRWAPDISAAPATTRPKHPDQSPPCRVAQRQ